MLEFLLGAIAAAYFVVGLFFLRFWRDARDRLFLMLFGAFWLLGVSRVGLAWVGDVYESRTALYLLRLFAYMLIIIAIVDKNRPAARKETRSPTEPP